MNGDLHNHLYFFCIALIWIVFLGWLFIPAIRKGLPVKRVSSWYVKKSFLVFFLAIIVIIAVTNLYPGSLILRIIPDSDAAGVAGIALTLLGLSFSAWARIHLGKYWSSMVMIKEGHQLIKTGPYQYVRNPMYTGMLCAFFGAVIAIGLALAFLVFGIAALSVWVKITAEEEILKETFGEEYAQYKREVKRIIPFII